MEAHRLPGGCEAFPVLDRFLPDQSMKGCRKKVFDAPTRDHSVIKCDRCGHKGHKSPHPCIVASHHLSEGADHSLACLLPDRKLDSQKGYGPDQEKQHPGDHKGTTAILGDDTGKTPQVSRADGHANSSKNYTPA